MVKTPCSILKARHQNALLAVKSAFDANPDYELVESIEASPSLENCAVIWRRKLIHNGVQRAVDVGLPRHFPDAAPIACVHHGEDLVGSNPHVMSQGLLCIIPESASIDSNDPVGLVTYVFDSAQEILNGTGSDDFREEFSYYWRRSVNTDANVVIIADPPQTLGPTFPVVFREGYTFVASSTANLERWLSKFMGQLVDLKDEKRGITIRVDRPLHPQEYPNTLADLVALADTNDQAASRHIKEHIANNDEAAIALLVQRDHSTLAIAAVTFNGLQVNKIRNRELNRGFRPGKMPPGLLLKRCAGRIAKVEVERNPVARVDYQYVHTRGGDGRDLSAKSVLLIGCGSLGSYVAHLMGRAGIGHISIIDNEKLGWENVGRHLLGLTSIGQWKAEAVAKELNGQMPHLRISGIPKDWREHLIDEPDLFSNFDLVLSTVADWRSEAPLNALARQVEIPLTLLGWLEPFAVAGHCLVIGQEGGCFQCAANTFGQFNHSVSDFEVSTLSKDSHGCAHYQQYGPIAVMPVASMIAAAVVDSLLEVPKHSLLHTWIGNEDHFRSVGAKIADNWLSEIASKGYSRATRKEWSQSKTCLVCHQ